MSLNFYRVLRLHRMIHIQLKTRNHICANYLQDSSRKTVIGLLDIYGFEVFNVNR